MRAARFMKVLLGNGADISARNINLDSILHLAVKANIIRLVQVLVDGGVTLEGRNRQEQTPLHFAAASGSQTTVSLLLSKGANVHATDSEGQTPEDVASTPEVKKILREHRQHEDGLLGGMDTQTALARE
jgi:ankyrin repeat protein